MLVRGKQTAGFVSRSSIEDSPRTITDAASLVEPLPGVHVRRLGADDSFATLSIRGSSSTQVAVYLAGVPLSGGADPTLDLATLPLWPGARATVHRTFAPASLGRGSLGGTLVIDPPSARSPSRTDVWTAAGSFGSARLRIGDVRGDPDGVRVATGISASRSDDDFSYIDLRSSLAQNRDVFATRENAGHAAAAGLASIAIPIRLPNNERGALTLTNLVQARKQELPGSQRALTPFQRLDSSRLLSALELSLPAGSEGTWIARGWGRREGLQLHDAPTTLFSPSSTDDAIVALGGSTGWRGRPTETTNLEIRIDGSGERFAPGTWIGGASPPGARRTNGGLAVDGGWRTPLHALELAASARVDTWFDSSDDGTKANETRPTGHLGVELPLGPFTVGSHAGFVARPPSFVERYGNRGAFIGDPNLKTESAFTVDLGARIDKRGTRGVWKRITIHAEAAGFATWAEDLITFVYAGAQGQAKATNIGQARLVGLEESFRASGYGVEARVSHTALATANAADCEFTTSPSVCERPPLPGRPAHDVVADLSWSGGPIRLRYGVDYVSGLVVAVDTPDRGEVPARILHGASIRMSPPSEPDLSFTFDIRNLFDLRATHYPGVLGGRVVAPIGDLFDYPLPGRRFMITVQYTQRRKSSPGP